MRPALLPILILLLLAACGRPLTEAERAFAAGLHGRQFDPGPVRLSEAPLVGLVTREYPARPRTTCRERILPPPDAPTIRTSTAGAVLFNHVYLNPDWFSANYLAGAPDRINLVAAMFFAHEMAHVWQWQNRDLTGYHPLRVITEHAPGEDPYLFEADTRADFLSLGYERQASLVEEYVCCRALDPSGARTHRLQALLSRAMDLTPIDPRAPRPAVSLPWDGAGIRGICS